MVENEDKMRTRTMRLRTKIRTITKSGMRTKIRGAGVMRSRATTRSTRRTKMRTRRMQQRTIRTNMTKRTRMKMRWVDVHPSLVGQCGGR